LPEGHCTTVPGELREFARDVSEFSRLVEKSSLGAEGARLLRTQRSGRNEGDSVSGRITTRLPSELADRFEVLRELKAGGEANILVVTNSDGTEVVLKLYRPGIAPSQEMWDAIRTVDSPFVVRLIESGESEFQAYEIMEYVPAGTLGDVMRDSLHKGLDTNVIADVVRQVMLGMNALHSAGIIHRDLKPGNILVRSAAPLELVLADFGLCRHMERTTVFSRAGNTLAYAAPESLSGLISPSRDWWSLGMMVRELATGEPPFRDLSPEEVTFQLTSRKIDCSRIADQRLRLLCRGLLVREPDDRWGAEDVSRWLAGETPEVRDNDRANNAHPWRHRLALPAAIVILLLAIGVPASSAFHEKTAMGHQDRAASPNRLVYETVSQRLVYESLTVNDPHLSALLAETAYEISPTSEARSVMVTTFTRESMTTLRHLGFSAASLAVSSNGKILAMASSNGAVRLWSVKSNQPIGPVLPAAGTRLGFSPDDKILATAITGGTAKLWNLASHEPISSTLLGSGVIHMAFSPNGKVLATANTDRTVRLWDVATHQQIGTPLKGAGTTAHMAFSLNSRILATASLHGTVRFWDVATHQQIGSAIRGTRVIHLGFSPDGEILATASTDGTVQLWRVASHQRIGTLLMGAGATAHLAFSPSSKVLVTASTDGTVRLWDVATHQPIGSAITGAGIKHMAFSLDDKVLATASAGHSVQIWTLPTTISPARLANAICAKAGRSLSREEWKRYLHPFVPYQRECPPSR